MWRLDMNKIFYILVSSLIAQMTFSINAQPHYGYGAKKKIIKKNVYHTRKNSNGTFVKVSVHGTEHFNWLEDPRGFLVCYNKEKKNYEYCTCDNFDIYPNGKLAIDDSSPFLRGKIKSKGIHKNQCDLKAIAIKKSKGSHNHEH